MLNRFILALVFFAPQAALAANVYVPFVCQTSGTSLSCTPNHPSAYQDAAGGWVIEVASGDTVYFQVSDFVEAGQAFSVSGKTLYPASTATWMKAGSTATSPGDAPVNTLTFELEGATAGKILKCRRIVKVDYKGA